MGLSPAQLLLHRQIRDHIPADPSHYQLHSDWILSAEERERRTAGRDQTLCDAYNTTAHPLEPLNVQTPVMIQTKGRWDKSGRIVEVLEHRQYRVRVNGSGRVTIRNRRFLRPVSESISTASSSPTPSPSELGPHVHSHDRQPEYQPSSSSNEHDSSSSTSTTEPLATNNLPSAEVPATVSTPSTRMPPMNNAAPARVPKALRDLRDYNSPGLVSTEPGGAGRTRSGQQ